MEEIQIFGEEHVEEAANLYLKAARGQNRPAPSDLRDQIRETYLCNPWILPEIPSLVYMERGKVVGFLGVIPRPMEFRGRPIWAATMSMWLVDRQFHRGLAGMKLLHHLIKGPQDFTFVDGASNEASSVFVALGARVSFLYSFNWVRILRPFQTGRSLFDRAGGVLPRLKRIFGLVTAPMDFLVSKAPVEMFRRPSSSFSSKPASAEELLACLEQERGREALQPAYTMPSFGWLIAQARKGSGRGQLRAMTVHSPDGALSGHFIYHLKPERPALVLQVASIRRHQFTDVLLTLFADAWDQGACAVKGQAIPRFLTSLTEQHCLFRQPYACVIGHSKNPEIMSAFETADAALSRLDAGWWLRFSSEDWA
jgi:hypothetical protein